MINFVGWIDLKLDSKLNSSLIENIFISEDIFTPNTITEALTCQNKLDWMKAIDSEMDRINLCNCFTICNDEDQKDPSEKPIKSKFVFRHKLLPNNTYIRLD
jgi:hypothetical protein